MKLKGEEVYDIKSCTSSANKISQEEIPDRNSTITEDEKQHDLVFDKETVAELGIPAEGKGIKDEREHAKNEVRINIVAIGNLRNSKYTEKQSDNYLLCRNQKRFRKGKMKASLMKLRFTVQHVLMKTEKSSINLRSLMI